LETFDDVSIEKITSVKRSEHEIFASKIEIFLSTNLLPPFSLFLSLSLSLFL